MGSFAAANLGYESFSAVSVKQIRVSLAPDVWYLVFQLLAGESRSDLFNACLVSRGFRYLATPALYRTVLLGHSCARGIDGGPGGGNHAHRSALQALLARLSDDSCDIPRLNVREVVVFNIGRDDNPVWDVISQLPNVRTVVLRGSLNLPEGFIEALSAHPRRPTIELVDQDGAATISTVIPQASSLSATVDLGWGINAAPNIRLLNLQKLLFACPALRSLSLTTVDQHRGCALRRLMFPAISNFKLTGAETFPPIQSLTLNGYQICHLEWPHWRDHFPWDGLASLTLGPQPDLHTLSLITGFARSIRHLTLSAYSDDDQVPSEDVDRFLLSFDTLVSLDLRGLSYSVRAVVNHPNLTRLCLHALEPTPVQGTTLETQPRRTLTAQDLENIDAQCPLIQDLELDCNRPGTEWHEGFTAAIASRFNRLRYLTVHLELGISSPNLPTTPVLNYTSARAIGGEFFPMRGSGRLSRLTLKTGEPLRRFSSEDALHRRWEQVHAATFEIQQERRPGEGVHVVHVEEEVLQGRRDRSEVDTGNPVDLRVRVQAASDGLEAAMQDDAVARVCTPEGRMVRHQAARETWMIPVQCTP